MKLVKACIAMAAFAALFVVPSMASAIVVEAPTGTAAATGTNIVATNVAHAGTAKHLLMTTPIGNITCDVATLTGPLLTNNVANPVGEITTVQFEGPTPGSKCTGPLGAVEVTPSHEKKELLPWCLKVKAEDTITVYGKPAVPLGCHDPEKTAPIKFTLHTAVVCKYEAPSVAATYTTHPADAVATVNGANFKRYESSVLCPAEGNLKMAFILTQDPSGKHEGTVDIK